MSRSRRKRQRQQQRQKRRQHNQQLRQQASSAQAASVGTPADALLPRAALQTDDPHPHAARKWYVLAASALGAFLATVMATSVNVILPSLVRAFATDFAVVQWVVLSFLLANTTLLPIIGRLADVLGKKSLFVSGFAVFVSGSLLCSLSPSIAALIGFRIVQGIGAGMLTALGFALITEVFPAQERGKAIGINGAVLSSGVVIGPTIGGFLVDVLSWRLVFALGIPIGLFGMLLAWWFVPASPPAAKSLRFDIAGSLSLALALLSLLLGLTTGQRRGFDDGLVWGLFVASALIMLYFVWLELHHEDPLLDLRLFRSSALSIGLSTGLVVFICIAGTIFLMPFYLENVLGYPPQRVGLLMAVTPIVLVIMAPISGSLSDRFGSRPVTTAGLFFLLIGYGSISSLSENTTALGYILRFLPVGLGMGTFQAPNNSAIMGSVPRGRAGVAGGLLTMTRTLGQTAGISVLGAIWATRVALHGNVTADVATFAPLQAQVRGLQDMLLLNQGLIACALALSIWGLLRERQRNQLQKLETLQS